VAHAHLAYTTHRPPPFVHETLDVHACMNTPHELLVPPTATQVRGKLSKLERKTLSSLVVIDVHARDTVTEMANIHVTDDADFDWTSQVPPEREPHQQSLTGRYFPRMAFQLHIISYGVH
jgi:hypothetical protein